MTIKQQIINQLKLSGGELPYNFYKIDKLPYTLKRKTINKAENIYAFSAKLININNFYYPFEIFTGKVKLYADSVSFELKPEYEIYGLDGKIYANSTDTEFKNYIVEKTYYADIVGNFLLDSEYVQK
jgi:hypothetical protein